VVGDDAFFRSLRNFINSPPLEYRTALSQDFIDVVEFESAMSLGTFFDQWLYRPGDDAPGGGGVYEPSPQPTYYFCGSAGMSGDRATLDLRVGQTQAGTPYVMPIDIRLKDMDGVYRTVVVNNTTGEQDFHMEGYFHPVEMDFDPDNWVLKSMALSINTCGLPPATAGMPYSRALRASYSAASYIWSTPGPLPPGISLSSTGILSGTTTARGSYTFPVTVDDGIGGSRTVTLTLRVVSTTNAQDWQRYE
jgi:hypothetical protein